MSKLRSTVGVALLVTVATYTTGCAGRGGQRIVQVCEPAEGTLEPGMTAAELAGTYGVTLVASGADAGTQTEGTIELRRQLESLRDVLSPAGDPLPNTTAPLYGTAEIDVEPIGAVRMGDFGSLDPERPGVLVLEQSGRITLRLGSEANQRGIVSFDAGYFALFVQGVSEEGFAGNWASGVENRRVEGYFCAVRTGD